MESSAGANIGEKEDSLGISGTIVRKDGNPDENVKAKRVTRSKGQSSRVQSGLNISKEADGKQGTKRKRSSVKSSPGHPVAGSNELSLGTEIVDQDQSHGSSNTQPEKQSPAEKSSLRKRGRKSNANSFPKDLCERTEKKPSEKKSKLDSCSVPSRVTQPRGKKILSDVLNQVGDRTNKRKSTLDEGNQVLQKCSKTSKPSLEGSVLLRRCDGPPTNKFTCAFCQSSEDTEVGFTITHWIPRCRPLVDFYHFLNWNVILTGFRRNGSLPQRRTCLCRF